MGCGLAALGRNGHLEAEKQRNTPTPPAERCTWAGDIIGKPPREGLNCQPLYIFINEFKRDWEHPMGYSTNGPKRGRKGFHQETGPLELSLVSARGPVLSNSHLLSPSPLNYCHSEEGHSRAPRIHPSWSCFNLLMYFRVLACTYTCT